MCERGYVSSVEYLSLVAPARRESQGRAPKPHGTRELQGRGRVSLAEPHAEATLHIHAWLHFFLSENELVQERSHDHG